MHTHEVPDTAMARLVRIETKLSVFMQTAQQRLNDIDTKIDKLQQTVEEIYPEEEETR
jgi:prefoldin subunit 5